MSIWTEVTAEIGLHKGCHFSVRRFLDEEFDELLLRSIHQSNSGDHLTVKVVFAFSDGNLPAAKALQRFIDKVMESGSSNYVDLTATIRFVN